MVNAVAPDQGMVIKAMLDNWHKIPVMLEERKKNGHQKVRVLSSFSPISLSDAFCFVLCVWNRLEQDNEPMFASPQVSAAKKGKDETKEDK